MFVCVIVTDGDSDWQRFGLMFRQEVDQTKSSAAADDHYVFVRDTRLSATLIAYSNNMQQRHCLSQISAPYLLSQVTFVAEKQRWGDGLTPFFRCLIKCMDAHSSSGSYMLI